MAPLAIPVENSGMSKRGPYKKAAPKPPILWNRTFLAQWRRFRGMTQEQLADAADVSIGTVSGMEAATVGYSPETLHKLAEALEIEVAMLLGVNPYEDEPLWAIIARANDKERQQIARHADVIVRKK